MLQSNMALAPSAARSKLNIEEEKASTEQSPSEDVEKALEDPPTTTDPTGQQEYPPMRRVIPIMVSLYLATFLVSLVSYTARNTFRITKG
jgi:ABC-type Na+ efflux pump permease subunit